MGYDVEIRIDVRIFFPLVYKKLFTTNFNFNMVILYIKDNLSCHQGTLHENIYSIYVWTFSCIMDMNRPLTWFPEAHGGAWQIDCGRSALSKLGSCFSASLPL